MGMYDEVLKKLPGGDGLFISLKEGHPVRLRVLDHPYISMRQFEETDPVTKAVTKSEPKTQFIWPVWDYESEKVSLLRGGKMIFKQVAGIIDAWHITTMPMECDISITTEGTGINSRYTLTASPHAGTMPSSTKLKPQLPDVATIVAGAISLVDFYKGETPPLITAGGTELIEAEATPVATSAKTADVVITDLDDDSKINLDDIPF